MTREQEQEEDKKIKIYLFVSIIEILYFILINNTFFSIKENQELLDLDLINPYYTAMKFYFATLCFILLINFIIVELKFLRKKIDKLILITFILITGAALEVKEVKIQSDKEFLITINEQIEPKDYFNIKESLIKLKETKEKVNKIELTEQYNKIIEIIKEFKYPISILEYKKFQKEKNEFYSIMHKLTDEENKRIDYENAKKDYEVIKSFK